MCQIGPYFWSEYPCHHQVHGYPSHWYFRTLGIAKKGRVCKKAVVCSNFFVERLFFDIISPSTLTFGGKNHWLLVIEDSTNYIQSYFLKEKSDFTIVTRGLIKNLKTKYNIQVQFLWCDSACENVAFEKNCKQEGMGMEFKFTTLGNPQQNAMLNRSLLPSPTGYFWCWTAGNSPLS